MAVLFILIFSSLAAGWLRPAGYAAQFRDEAAAAPSLRFPFGTDDLGRDLLARTLYGMRLSLVLAGGAALAATAVAALAGIAAGYTGGLVEHTLEMVTSLLMALPWIFVLLLMRALLPLDMPPEQSAWVTSCCWHSWAGCRLRGSWRRPLAPCAAPHSPSAPARKAPERGRCCTDTWFPT